MIELHRLGHDEPFHLNADLIVTVEAHPDTVISLATGTRVVVAESPDEVAGLVRDWRVSITNAAWRGRREPSADGALV
jgi:flagellar protein FlbD